MIFGQSLSGAEPQPSEALDWRSHPRFRQSGIFGDIQPWSLGRIWMELCSSNTWSPEAIPSNNWEDVTPPMNVWSESSNPATPWNAQTNPTNPWTPESVPDIDISRC